MQEIIKMQFPASSKYIKAIRLSACTVASELDFDFDEIEDIKLCVAEACIMIMCKNNCNNILVNIQLCEEFSVRVIGENIENKPSVCEGSCSDFSEEISRIIIESLTDNTVFEEKDGLLSEISFTKKPVKN